MVAFCFDIVIIRHYPAFRGGWYGSPSFWHQGTFSMGQKLMYFKEGIHQKEKNCRVPKFWMILLGNLTMQKHHCKPWDICDIGTQKYFGHSARTSSQAPSYARRLQSETMTYSLTYSLAHRGRATSVAKKVSC